jgi:spermidine synthase
MNHTTATPIHRAFWEDRLVEIYDEGDTRALYFGGKFLQSSMSLSAPFSLSLPYTHFMMFALLLKAELKNVLLIGLGAGSMVRFLHHHFPGCTIDAVDHSSHIIKLAKGYFQLPENDQVHIHCCDGYNFLAETRNSQQYDLILVDAFDEQGMSANIYTDPFFRLCKAALRHDGILSCNIWSGIPKKILEISRGLDHSFTNKIILPVPNRGNIIHNRMNFPVLWPAILRDTETLRQMEKRFGIKFQEIVKVAIASNMNFFQRLHKIFSA